jgi:hypothetical protein
LNVFEKSYEVSNRNEETPGAGHILTSEKGEGS